MEGRLESSGSEADSLPPSAGIASYFRVQSFLAQHHLV